MATTGATGDRRLAEALAPRFRGRLIQEGDPDYDEARGVWNGMIDRRPALIARCAGVADVIEAVRTAREEGLPLAVRGGGHQVAGTAVCDDGLVVDLSEMRAVRVDPERRTARAEGGATYAELDRETQAFGLATPGGVVSETGIAGLTLGGGIGWLRRKHGLSVDNLISVDVVTADGRLVSASQEESSDLFWGVRGGGGNFGVVTSFEYRLHPVGPDVMFCAVFHPGEVMKEALRFYRDWCARAPEEVTSFAICGTAPSEDPFPPETHGSTFVLFAACYAGPVEEGEAAVRELREFHEPLLDLSEPLPYVEVQSFFDEDYPAGELRYYWKSLYHDELADEALDVIADYTERRPSPLSTIDLWQMGGAVTRVGEDETAFPGRGVAFMLGLEANWADAADDAANIEWARDCMRDMTPFSNGVEYVNFPGFQEEGASGLAATFGAEKFKRLVELKRRYDPTNLFRLNQNIPPDSAA